MENLKLKLSDQACGAIMLALQQALIEGSDVVGALQNFEIHNTDEGLIVANPPVVEFPKDEDDV